MISVALSISQPIVVSGSAGPANCNPFCASGGKSSCPPKCIFMQVHTATHLQHTFNTPAKHHASVLCIREQVIVPSKAYFHAGVHCNTSATHLRHSCNTPSIHSVHQGASQCAIQSVFSCQYTWVYVAERCNTLQHAATRCNTLQHPCNTPSTHLQHTRNTPVTHLQHTTHPFCVSGGKSSCPTKCILWRCAWVHTATHQQNTATHCSKMQHTCNTPHIHFEHQGASHGAIQRVFLCRYA